VLTRISATTAPPATTTPNGRGPPPTTFKAMRFAGGARQGPADQASSRTKTAEKRFPLLGLPNPSAEPTFIRASCQDTENLNATDPAHGRAGRHAPKGVKSENCTALLRIRSAHLEYLASWETPELRKEPKRKPSTTSAPAKRTLAWLASRAPASLVAPEEARQGMAEPYCSLRRSLIELGESSPRPLPAEEYGDKDEGHRASPGNPRTTGTGVPVRSQGISGTTLHCHPGGHAPTRTVRTPRRAGSNARTSWQAGTPS